MSIFISYRRDDSGPTALNIGLYLEREFGPRNVFIDVDMDAGSNFPAVLEDRLAKCKILLAVIGPNWLQARDAAHKRRLDDPEDWVRLEISRALERGITVIPVLIGDTKIPNKADLPVDLQRLLDHQSARVTLPGFRNEMGGLSHDIRQILNNRPIRLIAFGAIVLVAAGGWIALRTMGYSISLPWKDPPPAIVAETTPKPAEPKHTELKFKGTENNELLRQVRCEMGKSVISAQIQALQMSQIPIGQQLADRYTAIPESIKSFSPKLLKDTPFFELMKAYYDTSVAYDFDRTFGKTDAFSSLLVNASGEYCLGYTFNQNDGIRKFLSDFLKSSPFVGPDKGPTTMVRRFVYTNDLGRLEKLTIAFATSEDGIPSATRALRAIEQFNGRQAQ